MNAAFICRIEAAVQVASNLLLRSLRIEKTREGPLIDQLMDQLMDRPKTKIISAIFQSHLSAEAAIAWLFRKSFRPCEISILFLEGESTTTLNRDSIGALSYLRHFDIPDFGKLICGGGMASVLANWVAAGRQGEVSDLLEELGISESQAKRYCGYLRNEHTLLYVETKDLRMYEDARQIFLDAGATELSEADARDLNTASGPFRYRYQDENVRERESYRPLI